MTDTLPTPRASFWRETFLSFKTALPFEGRWIIVLGIIVAISSYLLAANPDMIAMQGQLGKSAKSSAEKMDDLAKLWKAFGPIFAIQMIAFVIAFYSLAALYLRRVAPTSSPQFSPENFLLWIGTVCLKIFITIAIGAGIGVIAGLAFVVATHLGAPKFLLVTGGVLLWGTLIVVISFVSLRLCLTAPLSILRRRPILETSWKITQGSCWRIFRGNLALVFFFLLPLTIAVALVDWGAKSLLGATTIPTQIIIAVLEGLKGGAYLLLSVIYSCTVYRILLQEQRPQPPITQA